MSASLAVVGSPRDEFHRESMRADIIVTDDARPSDHGGQVEPRDGAQPAKHDPCLENGDPHDEVKRTSSGIVVLRRMQDGTPLFLLLRAWGHWDFPKGSVEDGESLIQAAIREVAEESNQRRLEFLWGDDHVSTSVYNRDKIAHYFIAYSLDPVVRILPNPVTGKKEHDHFLWATWSDLSRLLPPRLQPVVDWVAEKLSLPKMELVAFCGRTTPKISLPQRTRDVERRCRQ